jgi:hypothetical protein
MSDWYFNGKGKREFGFDALEDFTDEEKEAARIFVEKFKAEAPEGFVYYEPNPEQPFGSWTRPSDEFGGTSVILQVAQGSDATDYDYPDGFEMWVYAGEGMELASLPADWNQVEFEIRETIKAWSRPNPWSDEA